jgi:pSer/pThr/pTyr-binding forkhead associated (FHA) protein
MSSMFDIDLAFCAIILVTSRVMLSNAMTSSGLLNRLTIILVINSRRIPLPVAREVIVGRFTPTDSRQPDIDLNFCSAEQHGVSRQHLRIINTSTQFAVSDLGSTNGTWLNGVRLQPGGEYPLRHGDRLRLGNLELEVKLGVTAPTR